MTKSTSKEEIFELTQARALANLAGALNFYKILVSRNYERRINMTEKQAINTAVKWWSETLSKRVKHDNGDNSFASLMAMAMADMGTKDISNEQIAIFEHELSDRIKQNIEDGCRRIDLCCDYDPCRLLHEAAEKANIPILNFPFKTSMFIEKDISECYRVSLSDGYAQPFREMRPVRKHRKKRIAKKWAKKYGYRYEFREIRLRDVAIVRDNDGFDILGKEFVVR